MKVNSGDDRDDQDCGDKPVDGGAERRPTSSPHSTGISIDRLRRRVCVDWPATLAANPGMRPVDYLDDEELAAWAEADPDSFRGQPRGRRG